MSGPELLDATVDELVDFATADAEADCEATDAPAFAAVLARARALDPALPDMETDVPHSTRGPLDGGVDVFISSARAEAERDSRERELAGVPLLRSRPRRRWAVVGLGLAAASVAGVFALQALQGASGRHADDDGVHAPQAVASVEEERSGRTELRAPVGPRMKPPFGVGPEPGPDAGSDADLDAGPDGGAGAGSESQPAPRPTRTPQAGRERGEGLDARLARLDEEAESALRAGDHRGADSLYAEIIRIGGRRPVVEMAYADRFTLAHKSRDVALQRRLWTRYLRRFPTGRLADDARAGLCRQAAGEDAAGCWRAYLADFPRGAYRSQARRHLEGGAG